MNISKYRITVPELVQERMRIVQISDSHFGKKASTEKKKQRMEDILTAAFSLDADVFVMTGDLVSRTADEEAIRFGCEMLTALAKKAPVMYVFGNHETTLPEELRQKLLEQLAHTGAVLLNDKRTTICGVEFYGYVLPNFCYKNENGSYRRLEKCTAEGISSAIGTPLSPCVLLAHNPMGLDAYAQWGADVVFSGHVHGGIVRLPLIGGILSPERKFFPEYTKGCYRKSQTSMVVCAGVGKLRLFNPAEIVYTEIVRDGADV